MNANVQKKPCDHFGKNDQKKMGYSRGNSGNLVVKDFENPLGGGGNKSKNVSLQNVK